MSITTIEEAKTLIGGAFLELNKRIAPAKLKDTARNGLLITEWVRENEAQIPTTIAALADGYERAVKALLLKGELEWNVEPKALKADRAQRKQNSALVVQKSAIKSENEFADRLKQAGKEADQKLADKDSQRQIEELIANFQLLDHRLQRVAHGRTDLAKENLRKYVAQAKARGESLQVIAKNVAAKIADLYATDERSRQRV